MPHGEHFVNEVFTLKLKPEEVVRVRVDWGQAVGLLDIGFGQKIIQPLLPY